MIQREFKQSKVLAGVLAGLCLAAMGVVVMSRTHGSVGDRIFVLAVLLALVGLGTWLLRRGCPELALLWALLGVAAALLLRAMCLDYMSGDYNSFLAHWAAFFRDNGGFRAMAENIGDYNVLYMYFVAAISHLKTPDLYLYKLFSILFDVLLAWGSLRVVRAVQGDRRGSLAPAAAFVLTLLLPTVILNGSYWGQCDSVYGAAAVHALAFLLEDRPGPSVILMAVSFSFKLQAIFLLPLWGVMWLAGRVKFRQLWLFPAAYAVTILPALLLGKPLGDILGVYLHQMGEYSKLTLNAPSVFQFLPYGEAVDETLLSRLGIGLALALALGALAVGFFWKKRLGRGTVLAMAVVLVIGIPFFLPHMHERYFFLADVLTLCWACVNWRRAPVCLLAAGSSLACYVVYLRLKYSLILTFGSHRFVMALEAAAMLAALALAVWALARQLRGGRPAEPDGRESA